MLTEIIRVLAALVVLAAAVGKAWRWDGFRSYLIQAVGTSFLSPIGRTAVGLLTITAEAVIALGLGLRVATPYPAVALVVFLVCASGFVALQLLGRGSAHCPCWGRFVSGSQVAARDDVRRPQATADDVKDLVRPMAYAVRNSALCFAAIHLVTSDGAVFSRVSWWAVSPAVLMMLALTTSVLVERRKLRLPQHPRYVELAPRLAALTVLDFYRERPPGAP